MIVCWPIEGHSHQLSWDPTMYFQRTQGRTEGAKLVQFFRYNTKIGRQIILEQEHDKIAAHRFWIHEGISEMRLDKFCEMIWHDNYDHKIMMCLWLIAHRALPVGTWGKRAQSRPQMYCMQTDREHFSLSMGMSRQWLYGEGHYACFVMPLVRTPSTGDMLVGTVLRMMW